MQLHNLRKIDLEKKWLFTRHDDIFGSTGDQEWDTRQDQLTKIVLPASERDAALEYLEQFNLNSYSLFGTTDSTVETLGTRAIRRLE
jgi:hypothetical protein